MCHPFLWGLTVWSKHVKATEGRMALVHVTPYFVTETKIVAHGSPCLLFRAMSFWTMGPKMFQSQHVYVAVDLGLSLTAPSTILLC